MSKMDYARRSAAQRMHQQGTEAVGDLDVVYLPGQPRKRISKTQMREETARLLAEHYGRRAGRPLPK